MNAVKELLKTRKERFARSQFRSLIATPHNWATPLQIPQGAKLHISLGAGVVSNTVAFSTGGRDINVPPSDANEKNPVGFFGAGATLTAVYAGSMNLYYEDPLGQRLLIATKA